MLLFCQNHQPDKAFFNDLGIILGAVSGSRVGFWALRPAAKDARDSQSPALVTIKKKE